jgi:large subunit ribosomal protein L10
MRPKFARVQTRAGLVRTSDDRNGECRVRGQAFRSVVCPVCFALRLVGGRLVATRRFANCEAGRQNRKELAVDRAAKAESITELSGVFKTSNVVVVAHYSGLSVAQMQTLRKQMRQAGASVKVAKNRLAKIALKDTDVASIAPLLKGPTVLAYSGDPVAAPKVAVDFAKANEAFVILGGSMGKTALDLNGVKALASLPSLDELRGKIVGLLVSPATKIAQLVNAPAAKVARVVQAYASKSAAA